MSVLATAVIIHEHLPNEPVQRNLFMRAMIGDVQSEQLGLSSSSPSSQQQPKRPLSTLQRAINRKVAVRLKSEIEYKGRMNNVDSYMNLILTDAEEFDGADVLANYGKVVIRGNNVLFIKLEKEL